MTYTYSASNGLDGYTEHICNEIIIYFVSDVFFYEDSDAIVVAVCKVS